ARLGVLGDARIDKSGEPFAQFDLPRFDADIRATRASVAAVSPRLQPGVRLDDREVCSRTTSDSSNGNSTSFQGPRFRAGGGTRTRPEGCLGPYPLPLRYAGLSPIGMRMA